MTPLHCATVKGRVETMNLLLSASPLCVAEATEGGETAWHIAARNSRPDALRVLLEWLRKDQSFGGHKCGVQPHKCCCNSHNSIRRNVLQVATTSPTSCSYG